MASGRIGPIEVVATPARIARLRVVGSRGHRGRYDVSLSVTAAAGLTVRVRLGSVVIGTRQSAGRPLTFAARRLAVPAGKRLTVTTSATGVTPRSVTSAVLRRG